MRLVWKTTKDWGYISHDPFQGLRFPEGSRSKTYNFTIEESLSIIAEAPEQRNSFFWLLAETGMRPGELAGLKLEGIDWLNGTICIEQSVWQGKLQTPKSHAANRKFAISSELVKRPQTYRLHHWMRNVLSPTVELLN